MKELKIEQENDLQTKLEKINVLPTDEDKKSQLNDYIEKNSNLEKIISLESDLKVNYSYELEEENKNLKASSGDLETLLKTNENMYSEISSLKNDSNNKIH